MNDLFYAELVNAQKQINKILAGDDYDEIVRITNILEDTMDLIQTIVIVMERASFLDAYMKIGDYTDKPSIGEMADIFQIYIDNVELACLKDNKEMCDEELYRLFTMKCVEKERDPVTMLSMLMAATACMAVKHKVFFDARVEKLLSMLPEDIRYAYEKEGRIKKLELIYEQGVIMNYETLRRGEILFPKKLPGYSLVKFVDESLNEMKTGEIAILAALLQDEDLVNVMEVISGNGRKKIMDSLEYEDTLRISKKVILFSFIIDGKKEGILQNDEIYTDLHEIVIPSIKKAIEKILIITDGKFKYQRVQMEETKNEH